MPDRVQRQRTKGWRLPEGAVYVGRPTRWGNPYKVGDVNGWTGFDIADRAEARDVYAAEIQAMRSINPAAYELLRSEAVRELAGKDLMCWCPLDQPCHADVLLEIANTG